MTNPLTVSARSESALLIVPRLRDVEVLIESPNLNPAEGIKIFRANGQQRITFAEGGSIHFATPRTVRSYVRGRSFDHVIVDSRHESIDANDFRDDLGPCFTNGERYSVLG